MSLPMIQISRPSVGPLEKAAVLAVLESGHLAQGSRVDELEEGFRALTGAPEAVAVSSGTAGLQLALLAHGVGPGDEVITSPFSFVATVNSILMTGARPVFADIDPASFNLSPAAVRSAVTPRTRVIMPVHIYGRLCAMDELDEIASAAGATVVEDAAQAVGADDRGRGPGQRATAVYSLYATKNVMAGEGGVVTTHDPEVADRLRLLRNHGMRARYQYEGLGYNLRLTDLQAALGVVQLRRHPELVARRRANAEFLSRRLTNVTLPEVTPGHVWHQYTIRVRDRERAAAHLTAQGVGTGVFYPLGLHQVPHVAALLGPISMPACEDACREVLSLPVHPELDDEELERIVQAVNTL